MNVWRNINKSNKIKNKDTIDRFEKELLKVLKRSHKNVES